MLSLFNPYVNLPSQSSHRLLPLLLHCYYYYYCCCCYYCFSVIVIVVIIVVVLLLSIIYTINLPVVQPQSCQVIYYFDTPALGKSHQSFGRVSRLWNPRVTRDSTSLMISQCLGLCRLWNPRVSRDSSSLKISQSREAVSAV